MGTSHLLIIGEREALGWVLEHERMAFPGYRASEVSALQVGDELLLYTTRGCFHHPGRDRGRVVGVARATSAVTALDEPVRLAGRTFPLGCDLRLELLAPLGHGVDLARMVGHLDSFPNKKAWPARLRRPLLTLSKKDAAFVRRKLVPLSGPPQAMLGAYLAAAVPPGRASALAS